MKQFPAGGLLGKTVRLFRAISRLRVGLYASQASFFIILSLFPLLILLLGLLRHTGLSVTTLTSALEGVLPQALMPAARNFILSAYQGTPGTVLSISAVTALWSASRGVFALLTGLNFLYQVHEDRGWLYTRAVSVLYTFAFLLVLLLTLTVNVFGNALLSTARVDVPFLRFLAEAVDLRFLWMLFLLTGVFTLMFMVLPNRRNSLRHSLPGALLAAAGWLVFSDLFSLYVRYAPRYASVYGSVYALALSMLWLYWCVCIVFYGGALNRHLQEKRKFCK